MHMHGLTMDQWTRKLSEQDTTRCHTVDGADAKPRKAHDPCSRPPLHVSDVAPCSLPLHCCVCMFPLSLLVLLLLPQPFQASVHVHPGALLATLFQQFAGPRRAQGQRMAETLLRPQRRSRSQAQPSGVRSRSCTCEALQCEARTAFEMWIRVNLTSMLAACSQFRWPARQHHQRNCEPGA